MDGPAPARENRGVSLMQDTEGKFPRVLDGCQGMGAAPIVEVFHKRFGRSGHYEPIVPLSPSALGHGTSDANREGPTMHLPLLQAARYGVPWPPVDPPMHTPKPTSTLSGWKGRWSLAMVVAYDTALAHACANVMGWTGLSMKARADVLGCMLPAACSPAATLQRLKRAPALATAPAALPAPVPTAVPAPVGAPVPKPAPVLALALATAPTPPAPNPAHALALESTPATVAALINNPDPAPSHTCSPNHGLASAPVPVSATPPPQPAPNHDNVPDGTLGHVPISPALPQMIGRWPKAMVKAYEAGIEDVRKITPAWDGMTFADRANMVVQVLPSGFSQPAVMRRLMKDFPRSAPVEEKRVHAPTLVRTAFMSHMSRVRRDHGSAWGSNTSFQQATLIIGDAHFKADQFVDSLTHNQVRNRLDAYAKNQAKRLSTAAHKKCNGEENENAGAVSDVHSSGSSTDQDIEVGHTEMGGSFKPPPPNQMCLEEAAATYADTLVRGMENVCSSCTELKYDRSMAAGWDEEKCGRLATANPQFCASLVGSNSALAGANTHRWAFCNTCAKYLKKASLQPPQLTMTQTCHYNPLSS
jgi:hypothetical protein